MQPSPGQLHSKAFKKQFAAEAQAIADDILDAEVADGAIYSRALDLFLLATPSQRVSRTLTKLERILRPRPGSSALCDLLLSCAKTLDAPLSDPAAKARAKAEEQQRSLTRLEQDLACTEAVAKDQRAAGAETRSVS